MTAWPVRVAMVTIWVGTFSSRAFETKLQVWALGINQYSLNLNLIKQLMLWTNEPCRPLSNVYLQFHVMKRISHGHTAFSISVADPHPGTSSRCNDLISNITLCENYIQSVLAVFHHFYYQSMTCHMTSWNCIPIKWTDNRSLTGWKHLVSLSIKIIVI